MDIIKQNPLNGQPLYRNLNEPCRALSAFERPSEMALGNIANNASVSSKRNAKQRRDGRKYKNFSQAKTSLKKANVTTKRGNSHRTRSCMDARAHGAQAITIRLSTNSGNSSASLGNIQTCGSIWACPVCAPRIAVQRGHEIQKALDYGADNGLIPVLVSLTAQHNFGNKLADLRDQFKLAWRAFTSGRVWRRLRANYQIKNWIANREAPHGENGWHYHMHMLLFVPAAVVAGADEYTELETDLRVFWLKCLKKADLQGIGDYALKISRHGSVGEKYLSKLGLVSDNKSDLRYEMSGSGNKAGGGLSSWALLDKATDGDEKSERLYVEFVAAMEGEKWVTWSRGFKALVGVDDVDDLAAAADENNDAEMHEDWLEISDEDFRPVRIYQAHGDLLAVASYTRSKSAVRAFLAYLKDHLKTGSEQLSSDDRKEVDNLLKDIKLWRAMRNATIRDDYIISLTEQIDTASKRLQEIFRRSP